MSISYPVSYKYTWLADGDHGSLTHVFKLKSEDHLVIRVFYGTQCLFKSAVSACHLEGMNIHQVSDRKTLLPIVAHLVEQKLLPEQYFLLRQEEVPRAKLPEGMVTASAPLSFSAYLAMTGQELDLQNFGHVIAIAERLFKQGDIKKSVQTYYDAFVIALSENDMEKLDESISLIKSIDSSMQYLDANQKVHLLSQSNAFRLSRKLRRTEGKLQATRDLLEQRTSSLEEMERKKSTNSTEIEKEDEKRRVLQMAFGKAHWDKYFGDIGLEPDLPSNIDEILKSPCPFFDGKKIEETHRLILIPKIFNGKPFTYNRLVDVIQKPKQGYPSEYWYASSNYNEDVCKKYGDEPVGFSHWILVTKKVLPDSLNKTYSEQFKLVEEYSKAGIVYEIPRILEAALSLFTHYVRTGEIADSQIYTNCQEKMKDCPLAIDTVLTHGDFGNGEMYLGPNLGFGSKEDDHTGVSCVRKL